jgi:NADPH-dependent 2,4-dienoyl-CoA reductase/sulfur reductase-like enzyme/peroxiredoxin family protein/rhodanese-related sulfurtransferase/TusA-related sulfurtransferase
MRIIIVGGGAAGASCAARLRRLDETAQITILERTNEISIANCGLPYYCSDVISDRDKMLVSNPGVFKRLLNVDVELNSAVTSINRERKTVTINGAVEKEYDKLVLALGVNPIIPPIEGVDDERIFTVRTLNDADKIKNNIKTNNAQNAVVIGGGFIGVEMAENFAHIGMQTSLVELSDQLLGPLDKDMSIFAENQMRENGVELYLSDGVSAFKDGKVILSSGREIDYDIVIMAIGVRAETGLVKDAGLELGTTGAIKVNEYMQTSDPDIYAAGDSVEVLDFVTDTESVIPLAGPANRQGRIIADNIIGGSSTYKKSQGTAVVKVFDLTVASVGNNEKRLAKLNIPYKKVHVGVSSHAGYYPGSFPLFVKLIFGDDGTILGAQAVGAEGVEKRIDVIASVMRLGGKVQDLVDSELSYAPPYSSAKDPVNIVGMAADNVLKGYFKPAFYEDLKESYLIDVRPPESYAIKTIEEAVNIPSQQIRERMAEVPRDKKVVLFCNRGFNSYVAQRVLLQNGYDNVYSFTGGYGYYKEILKSKQETLMSNSPQKTAVPSGEAIRVDACGLQCPGPIMKLSESIKSAKEGQIIELLTTDSGFKSDVAAWAETTGNTLLSLGTENKIIVAKVQKGKEQAPTSAEVANGQTIVIFSSDFDKAMASFVIANGALAAGKPVTMFFTFWGLNILRKSNNAPVKKSIIDHLFGLMMPKGVNALALSKMNMGGLGSLMMKWVMKKKNIATLQELMNDAQRNGAKFIACNMSMDVMGIKQEELIDGIEIAGVAKYIAESSKANSNLFI